MSGDSHEGGCACGGVRYRMTQPLFVHCCHCTWCQRETGSAFVLNAMIEADRVQLLLGLPKAVMTPSASGRGQTIHRCPECHVALWSCYSGAGPKLLFVRVGTLDDSGRIEPDVHIYTSSKLPWVVLPPETPRFEAYYKLKETWPAESQERLRALKAG